MTMGNPIGILVLGMAIISTGYLVLAILAYTVGLVADWPTTRETGRLLAVWSFLPSLVMAGIYVLLPALPGRLFESMLLMVWPIALLAVAASPFILAANGVAPSDVRVPWHTREETSEEVD